MSNDCLYASSCPGNQPIPKPLHARRHPHDFYYRVMCGGYCPDYKPKAPAPQEQVIVHRYSNMGKQEYDLLQQTARRAIYLENNLKELTKPKGKPQRNPSGYKGIK